jgi:hypothetical protein
MGRGINQIAAGAALFVAAGAAMAAAPQPKPAPIAAPAVQNCDAHRFETTIQLMGADGQTRQSKVKMCGTDGQSDADWIRTLEDAVKKTSLSAQMPLAAKEQIISAVNAEIARLSKPTLALPAGTDISKLPKAGAREPEEAPLARDYGALPPLPVATAVAPPNLLGPGGGIGAPAPRLSLRCALAGDEDRPNACDTIDKDTVLVVRADEAFPRGVEMRFVRHGDQRAELDLPALRAGQTASLRLPKGVCTGVVRSKVEIQALGGGAPSGTAAGTIGEYDLRC